MKIERVNSEIRKELIELITLEVKDPRVHDCEMLSIMRAETTGDLKYCKVYVSVMGSPDPAGVISGLNAASGYLRNELFARLKIRAVPELIFVLDDSIEYGLKIDRILKELNKDEKK